MLQSGSRAYALTLAPFRDQQYQLPGRRPHIVGLGILVLDGAEAALGAGELWEVQAGVQRAMPLSSEQVRGKRRWAM